MIDLRLLVAAVTAAVALSGKSFAAFQRTIDVITHAAFFSEEMKQSEVVAPHVFVQDIVAPETVGPLGIKHVAGLRPALIERALKLCRSIRLTAKHWACISEHGLAPHWQSRSQMLAETRA
jgi:hypothetical protein